MAAGQFSVTTLRDVVRLVFLFTKHVLMSILIGGRNVKMLQKNELKKTLFSAKKMKTNFQSVIPHWEQRKNTRHIIQNMSDLF